MISPLKLRHVVGLFLSLFMSTKLLAQTYELRGDYYLRSSTDFLSSENKIGVLHNGSTFRVVNRSSQGKGAEALEIIPTAMTQGSYIKPSHSGPIFIYKPNLPNFINRSGDSTVTSEAGVAKCATCEENNANSTTSAATNRINLGRVADEVVIVANQAPKSTTTPEPILPLIGPPRAGDLDVKIKKYSDSPEVAKMIAWAMKNKSASSRGKCYRSVKEAAANKFGPSRGGKGPGHNLTAFPSTDIKDFYALSAKTRLKEIGFVNLLETEPYKTDMPLRLTKVIV